MHRLLVAALLCVAAAASADPPARLHAYVYDLATDRYLYTEVHEQTVRDGALVASTISYHFPDGTRFGRKTIDYAGDPFLPRYRLDLDQEGYVEAITGNRDAIAMMRRKPGDVPDEASVRKDGLVAADAGLLRLLQAHFEKIMAGETIAFRVAAPSRLDTYKFRARRAEDTTFEGKPAVRMRVDMDSMLKLFAGPLLFTFDPETRELREFRGPTNVRNPATGKDYTVRLAFYSKPPQDAPKLP